MHLELVRPLLGFLLPCLTLMTALYSVWLFSNIEQNYKTKWVDDYCVSRTVQKPNCLWYNKNDAEQNYCKSTAQARNVNRPLLFWSRCFGLHWALLLPLLGFLEGLWSCEPLHTVNKKEKEQRNSSPWMKLTELNKKRRVQRNKNEKTTETVASYLKENKRT